MHLKQLRVSGFKSFAEDQVINFNSGLTAIVGPNGCGKTNIIDTIRWVLGEQRVRILRAERMEDVIFSGTIRRKPLNFAEATLTIDNRDRSLQSDADTVQITRRIFRTGESEYLINKKLCRLKDLHALFFDTGMGLGSYSLIEQKMIDLILSDKDEERRVMFEEAAGIHKYRNQRKEALRNLLKTSDDLKRISDIVGEKDRYVKSLARHVTKAQKYREYRDELKKIEVAYTGTMFRGVCEKMKEAGRSHAELKADKERMTAEIATIEAGIEEKRLESHTREEKVMLASQEAAAIADRIHTLEKEMALVSAKTEAAHRAMADLSVRHAELEAKAGSLAETHKGHEGRFIEQEAELKSAEEAYAAVKQELDAVENEYQEKRQALAGINAERLRVLEERTELLSRMEKIRSDIDNLLENKAAIERTVESEERRIEECGTRISESKDVLNRATTEYEAFASTRDRLYAKIQEEEHRYRQILEEEKNLSAHVISDRKSLTFIEEMQKNHEGYKDAVRSIVERSLEGIAGIVADVINVNPEYLAPVEAALGSRVQFILADTREVADQAIAYLQEGKMGKASFIIHNQINTGERPAQIAALESIEGVVGWMEKFVTFQEKYAALSSLLFGDVLLVKDAAAADRVRIAAGATPIYCVTPEGTIYNTSGIVRGGEFTSEELGLLSRAKVIETLKESIRKHEAQIQFKEGEKAASLQTIKEAQVAMLEIDEKLSSGQRVRQEQEGSIRYLDEEIMRIQSRKNESLEKIRIIDARCEETREDERTTEQKLAVIEEKKTELEGSLIICEEEAGTLEKRRFEVTEKAKNVEVALQSVIHQLDSTRREIGRMAGEIEDTYAALADCRRQQQAYEGEIAAHADAAREYTSLRETAARDKDEREQHVQVCKEEYHTFLNAIDEARAVAHDKEKQLSVLADKVHECEMELEKLSTQRRHLVERMYEEYEVDLNTIQDADLVLDLNEESVRERIEVLRKRLKLIGANVNLSVLEDYEEEKKSFEALARQKDDLENAKSQLEKLIRKLDKEANEKFVETFEIVRQNFRKIFIGLFEGGEADVRLEENEDSLEAKIVIYARPSGKSMKNISLLSGGERALTATALLFALYLVKSSPYCILDEVDGPLDDANIGRFIKLIRQFSQQTQFLIITHNKKTMAACDVLYGVTLIEPGVSKMVSVSLASEEEEKKIDALLEAGAPA